MDNLSGSSLVTGDTDLPRYKYKPLNGPNDIRVLELSTTKTRIGTRILHIPVSSRTFQALSYVWGKSDRVEEAVILDNLGRAVGRILLTKNLGDAIRNLRDTEGLDSKVFWIDQISINQHDELERNQQVAMMGQIYTQATRVITYLGPAWPEEEEKLGIRLLERIYGNIPDNTWQLMHKAGSLQQIQDGMLDGSIHLERLPSDLDLEVGKSYDDSEISKRYIEQGWKWLLHVAYGEWTQRMWIVQEQLLNEEITALHGYRLVSWNAITAIPTLFAIGYLPERYHDTGRSDLGESLVRWDEVELTLYGIWWDRRARRESETDYIWSSLCHNLQWYQPLLCGDARDRVYAILAISQDSEILGLKPDYSAFNTVDALSTELSVRVLKNAVSLELLSFTFSWRQPNSTLPSWCLTLDRPASIDTPESIPVEVYTPHPTLHGFHLARFQRNNSILSVKGRILDHVSTQSSSVSWPRNGTTSPARIEFLSSLINILAEGFSSDDIVSVLRTVTARAPWSPPPSAQVSAKEELALHLWAYLRHMARLVTECVEDSPTTAKYLLERYDDVMEKVKALPTRNIIYSKLHSTDDIDREEEVAIERVLQYSLEQGRRIGCTRGGRFCNAMYTVQQGDAIVALQGADQLFIIRKFENTYRLIGDIFVDGLMHGEAYKDQVVDNVDYEIDLA